MKMTGNTVLITGGTSGIGLELAMQLSKLGNRVIVTGREQDKVDLLPKEHPGIAAIQSDVSEPTAVQELARRLAAEYPEVNVLVNNAGIMRKINLHEGGSDSSGLTSEIEINLVGPIHMVKAFLPLLKKQPNAAIVNVSSSLAFVPFSISPVYSASKAGVHAFTQALRVQLKNTRIKVFELAPPSTQTALQGAFSGKDVKASANMAVGTLVGHAIKGLQRDRLEIRPGNSNALKLLSRFAPSLALRMTSGSVDEMLASTRA